ncbi:MAG: hypothetical protein AAGG45_01725 [Pseudomonadota bacterium]
MKFFTSRLKKRGKTPKVEQVTPDLARLNIKSADPQPDAPKTMPDMQEWLDRDLQALDEAWQIFVDDPSRHHWQGLSQTIHNFHGASGAYGGGALTRLTESLQRIVSDHLCCTENQALINLHVQACHAWAIGTDEARTTLAEAVCDALELQVRKVT